MSDTAQPAVTALDVRRAAMDLLARREHGQQELCDKLGRRFEDAALVRAEVLRLREEGLQSDARFAEVYVRSRAQRLYGPSRIRMELRERRIAEDLIEQALAEAGIDWAQQMRELIRRKFGRQPPETIAERAKQQRFLAYRGFHQFRLADLDENRCG